MEYSFTAGLLRLEAASHRAIFYLMNTSRNRNRWSVTEKSLEEGLPTIKGKPLGCRAGYQLGHVKDPQPGELVDAGVFTDYHKPGSYALGVAEIRDSKVWEKLVGGEWGPVSVVVQPYAASCSVCGADVTKEGFNHEHIRDGPGYAVVESFTFTRVDFVEDPAYPQAGLHEILAEAARAAEQPLTLLAGYYEGHASQSSTDRLTGAGAPPIGGSKPSTGDKELTDKEQELKTQLEAANAEITRFKAEAEAAKVKAGDVATLRAELDAIKATRHQAEVDAAAEARVKAGLTKDLSAEKQRLKDLPEAALRDLKAAAEEVQKVRLEAGKPAGPKAQYGKPEEDSLTASVEETRMRLFGYRRNQQ